MDYALIYDRLVPATQYRGSIGTPTFVWTDERAQPTEAECEAEWAVYLEEKAIEDSNAQAKAAYDAAIEAGYNHNGVIFDCDEQFTTDLVKMVMLVQLQPEEPVYLMDKTGTVHTMSCVDFLQFSADLGYYSYGLRQNYWASLQ